MTNQLLNHIEVAEYFRVTPEIIKKWRKRGLKYIQLPGGHTRYFLQDVYDYIEQFNTKEQQ